MSLSIHIIAQDRISFFLGLHNILLYVYPRFCLSVAMVWMFVSHQNSYVEILTP